MSRVTVDDLAWAAEWVASFDPEDRDPKAEREGMVRRDRVAAWILAELNRRDQKRFEAFAAKTIADKLGISVETLRAMPKFQEMMRRHTSDIRDAMQD